MKRLEKRKNENGLKCAMKPGGEGWRRGGEGRGGEGRGGEGRGAYEKVVDARRE